jgi:hypothetical protein
MRAFWLLSMVAGVENSVGFVHKFRDSHKAFLGQRSSNHHGSYIAIEEFIGCGRRKSILIHEGKKKWCWCGFMEVLQFLQSPFIPVKRIPPAIGLPSLQSHPITMNQSFAQVVAEQGDTSTSGGRGRRASVAAYGGTQPLAKLRVQQSSLPVLPMPVPLLKPE